MRKNISIVMPLLPTLEFELWNECVFITICKGLTVEFKWEMIIFLCYCQSIEELLIIGMIYIWIRNAFKTKQAININLNSTSTLTYTQYGCDIKATQSCCAWNMATKVYAKNVLHFSFWNISQHSIQIYCRWYYWLHKTGWSQVWQKFWSSMIWTLSSLGKIKCEVSHGRSVRMYNICISPGLSVG